MRQVRFAARLLLPLLVGALALGCSSDDDTSDGPSGGEADAGGTGGGGGGSVGDAGGEDVELATCQGIAAENRAQFAIYDSQCEFLTECPTLGQCFCGAGCSEADVKCDAALCEGVDDTCYCGPKCDDEGKTPECPNYICKDLDIDTCAPQTGCVFKDVEQPAYCDCQTMSNTSPDCYCGSDCTSAQPRCKSSVCLTKPPEGCTVVPGEEYEGCYCATCGLLGNEPKCFFVVCP